MDEIKEFVYDEVLFRLETYHSINTDNDVVSKIIDEEYSNFVQDVGNWEPEPFIDCVLNRILSSL